MGDDEVLGAFHDDMDRAMRSRSQADDSGTVNHGDDEDFAQVHGRPQQPHAAAPAPESAPMAQEEAPEAPKRPSDYLQGRQPLTLDEVDLRLTQEMARCLAEHDAAMGQLKQHHSDTSEIVGQLQQQIERKAAEVEALLHGDAPLDQQSARASLEYMDLLAQLREAQTGQRLSLTATMPRAEQHLGHAVGIVPETKK